ncbi:MAG: WD40/YVTN/BNR-like repeat-containing protein, partial [Bacillota bacterium]
MQTSGPYGGKVICLSAIISPSEGTKVFAASDAGGIFSSTNYGSSWNKLSSVFTSASVSSLCPAGKHLIAGTIYKGIFISTDNGIKWKEVNNGIKGYEITSIACGSNAEKGINLYAGTYGKGIYLSTDYGESW